MTVLTPMARTVREVLSGPACHRASLLGRIESPAGAAGWFQPEDPIWTVHGGVASFVGGIRGLLMQCLHPLAVQGVAAHSSYRDDPLGRLQRISAFVAATTYGPEPLAHDYVEMVLGKHDSVAGVTRSGQAYSARDPRLLEWVHLSLVDSMLTSFETFGPHGVSVNPDGYVANMAVVGSALGVVNPPTTVLGLSERLESFAPELWVGPEALHTASMVMHAPVPNALRPGYRLIAAAARDSLADWAVLMLHEHPGSLAARRARRVLAEAMLRTVAAALVESPAKAAAERRLGHRPAPPAARRGSWLESRKPAAGSVAVVGLPGPRKPAGA